MRLRMGWVFLVVGMMILGQIGSVAADNSPMKIEAESAILMEASTGEVLFSQNENKPLPPASVTKMMVMLLAMEAIDSGKLKLTDKITASPEACRMGGSQIWLEPGESMTVSDLMKAVCIVSANDASYAIAEHLAGSEEQFIQKMNKRSQELGLKQTRFVNTTGLTPDAGGEGNITSAKDMAVLARELLKHPSILKWTGTWLDSVRDGNSYLRNTNNLVRFYQGCDGLKTGFTEEAGFCLVSTAKRNGVRMIAVVMKAPNSKVRSREVSRLFNYGFSLFQATELYPSGAKVGEAKILLGDKSSVSAILPNGLQIITRKENTHKPETTIKLPTTLKAPIRKGQTIGEVFVSLNGQEIAKAPLIAAEDIRESGFLRSWLKIFKEIFGTFFNPHST